jgi:hypothetical protein
MNFFTRELYEFGQPKDGLTEEEQDSLDLEARERWKNAEEQYKRYLNTIRAMLPESVQRFTEVILHDSKIVMIEEISMGGISILLNTTVVPWVDGHRFKIDLRGIHHSRGLQEAVGNHWLYEEFHLFKQSAFELNVLCDKTEFEIAADNLEFDAHPDLSLSQVRAFTQDSIDTLKHFTYQPWVPPLLKLQSRLIEIAHAGNCDEQELLKIEEQAKHIIQKYGLKGPYTETVVLVNDLRLCLGFAQDDKDD